MFQERKPNPEVLVKAKRRRISAEYKRRIIVVAEKCGSGKLGLLQVIQILEWLFLVRDTQLSA